MQNMLLVFALIGTCMVIGDGVLTPAISVFSTVSGLELSMSKEQNQYVEVPVVCAILILLFSLQHYGTHRLGFLFAPIVLAWLLCISTIGVYNIFHWNPHVYKAFYPYYIYKFLKKTRKRGWMSLGGILLCITGSEAMFADLGHFTQLSIQIAFTFAVYPSLILAYMGQAANLSKHHALESDYRIGFYVSVPEKIRWPVLAIAILAAVVGSQAIITGTFSIIKQCTSLDCFPKVKILHTSSKMHGQIYIPEINWNLMLLCLTVTVGFRDTKHISNASEIVSGLVTNVASMLWKWLWSLQTSTTTTATTKSGVSSRSMVKYESGYNIETVFDGSKLGIEPYAIEVSPNGEELIVLDSENSNIHKISMPFSRYGKPKLVSGSQEGYTGHVDGKLKEAKMNRPRGLAIDDSGNIYVADTNNMAIRKISDDGVSTIAAGGRWSGGSKEEMMRFSDDFDLIYVSSSCSLLVIDRGNQMIREIQLHDHDCYHHEPETDLHLGTALLVAAGFFGYMFALLVRRVRSLFSSPRHDNKRHAAKPNMTMAPYQRYPRPVRQPLIPPQYELEKEEGFLGSLGKLVVKTGSSVSEMMTGSRNVAPQDFQYHHPQQPNQWPVQENFAIPEEDVPPALEPKSGTNPDKPYLRAQGTNQNRSYYQDYAQYQNQQKRNVNDTASLEENREKNEIVFGAVQEQDGRREAMVIKAVDFNEAMNDQRNLRPRINYMGYSSHVY